MSKRIAGFSASVFSEFTALAAKHDAVNLGQGYPTFGVPEFVSKLASDAICGPALNNQYCRSQGHPLLVQAIAQHYNAGRFRRLVITDPETQILVTPGATQAFYTVCTSLLDEGDQAIVIDPYYDAYVPQIKMAGGIPISVPLRCSRSTPRIDESTGQQYYEAADWKIDVQQLENAINEKTKLLVINTPHNPFGKIFSEQELQEIADVVRRHPRIVVVSDVVYEELTYDNVRMCHIADFLPDRTITISSAGKTFSVTGWKLGWAISESKELIHAMSMSHQWQIFCVATPLQLAMAQILSTAAKIGFYDQLRADMTAKRDKLFQCLLHAQLCPIRPASGYFIVAASTDRIYKSTALSTTGSTSNNPDFEFCRWLTTNVGVTAIPPSAFYAPKNQHLAFKYARFAFCKEDKQIDDACVRLSVLRKHEV